MTEQAASSIQDRRPGRLTRDELTAALQRMVRLRGHEGIRLEEFCGWLNISQRQVYREFRNWTELRKAAGLKSRRAPIPVQYTNAELIREYQRITHELGRLPTESQFNRMAGCCYTTLTSRFGGIEGVRRALRLTEEDDAARREAANDPLIRPGESAVSRQPLGPDYLRRQWAALRIGYAVTSSEFRGRDSVDFDLLFCLHHNWPACPCKVIELHEVWRHPQDREAE